ncbi:hypothetical protein GHK86_04165 [Acidimicrobiaceae bacterium USS-CC1]|uniref:SEC-C domain-containing protein n=1 Tax=Acidiferrimicrobium australe TaxID=2664430 RepID=A0ABW9QQ28_9ACTN|nr:hypothetical protein [Acidiferrimicrobium australe]
MPEGVAGCLARRVRTGRHRLARRTAGRRGPKVLTPTAKALPCPSPFVRRPTPARPTPGSPISGPGDLTTSGCTTLGDLPADHAAYSQRVEGRLERLARTLAGQPIRVSPLTVDGLTEFGAREDEPPGSGAARSSYAAEVARRGGARPWPPGRNVPCWCGSGRTYKTCCGPVRWPASEPRRRAREPTRRSPARPEPLRVGHGGDGRGRRGRR